MWIGASEMDYKGAFEAWLIKRGIKEAFLIRRTLSSISRVFGVEFNFCSFSLSIKNELQKRLFRSSYFRHAPKSERQTVLSALDLYEKFYREEIINLPISQQNNESLEKTLLNGDKPDVSENYDVQSSHNRLLHNGINPQAKLSKRYVDENIESTELEILLKDEKFMVLRNKLKSDGIFTVKQVRKISFFQYMNENNLYSYRKRLEILEDLKSIFINKVSSIHVDSIPFSSKSKNARLNNFTPRGSWNTSDNSSVGHASESSTHEKSISNVVKNFGISGGSIEKIQNTSTLSRNVILEQIEKDSDIMEIAKDRYVHKENVIDVEEMADSMLSALEKIFKRFGGYSSDQVFYDEIQLPLALPLNDNDFDNCAAVFALARHFFGKEKHRGRSFVFYNGMHIWEKEPAYPKTMKGLAIHHARRVNGLVSYEDMAAFFEDLRYNVTNLKQVMGIGVDYTFLQYDENSLILGELLATDGEWIEKVSLSLECLFTANEFVVIRDIDREWYSLLPELPFGLDWSPLLLQEVLGAREKIGYRTIPALSGQRTDTIHAAIVPVKSLIKNFADFVAALLHQFGFSNRRMSSEELRSVLKEKGVLVGGELVASLHRALDDYRFAWSIDKKTVLLNE